MDAFARAEVKVSESKSSSSAASGSTHSSLELTTEVPRELSLSTCVQLGAIGLLGGVVIGLTFGERIERWASKMLKRFRGK